MTLNFMKKKLYILNKSLLLHVCKSSKELLLKHVSDFKSLQKTR